MEDDKQSGAPAEEDFKTTPQPDAGTDGEKTVDDELAAMREEVEAKKKEVEEEQARRRATEAELAKARQEVESTMGESVRSRELAINNFIAANEQERQTISAKIAQARAAGNVAAEMENIEKLADLRFQRRQAEQQLAAIKEAKESEAQKLAARREQLKNDPLSVFTPTTRTWLEAHPDAQPGARNWNKARAADILAQEEGLKPDTPQYFAFVEKQLYPQQQEGEGTEPPTRTRVASNAAPPSRGNGAGQAKSDTRRVKLTDSERDLALRLTSLGKTPEERLANYAKNKMAAIQRGEIPGVLN